MTQVRRTQAQRKAATVGRLVEAAAGVLAERGFAGASTRAICERAGVSQGALFRHFASRNELFVATLDQIATEHVAAFRALAGLGVGDRVDELVLLMRGLARSDRHAAWREIVSAARTHADLAEAAEEAVARFEGAIVEAVAELTGQAERTGAATVVLSLMHLFDSEAVTVRVKRSPDIEAARVRWAADVLKGLLQP